MTRRILMITAGGTPQVVTETLHALATASAPWWPDEIALMTTRHGGDLYRGGDASKGIAPLLGAGGRLGMLVQMLGRPLPATRTLVARQRSGAPIVDLRSEAEVTAFADALIEEMRAATEGDTELHLSLAGGRKTMSYLAGAVLSIYGRTQDRLSHVLVEPRELEGVAEFWWPGQTDPAEGDLADGRHWRASEARAVLHTVPFVRIRAYLPQDEVFQRGQLSFAKAVARANEALAADRLVIDTPAMTISAGGTSVAISEPVQFAVYRLFAEARRDGWSIGGEEAGALRYADLLFEKDAAGSRLLDRLGEIVKDVWMRGKGADYIRAEEQRDAFLSLAPRGPLAKQGKGLSETEMLTRRIGPHISDLRKTLGKSLAPAVAARAAPKGRGLLVIPWDPERIEIR